MIKLILYSIAVAFMSGCSTYPPRPEARENLYAVQVLSIKSPSPLASPVLIEDLLKTPETNIYEFPITYVEMGESTEQDQTYYVKKPPEMDDSDVNRFYDPNEKMRRFYYVQLLSATNSSVTYFINIWHQIFTKFAPYEFDDGEMLTVAHVDGGSIITEVTQGLNEWKVIDGLREDSKGRQIKSDHYFFIRIIPPTKYNFDTPQAADTEEHFFCSYIPSFTLYRNNEISPDQAITLAKEFATGNISSPYDINTAYMLFNEPRRWVIEFTNPNSGVLPNTIHVLIDKQTGTAQIQIVPE